MTHASPESDHWEMEVTGAVAGRDTGFSAGGRHLFGAAKRDGYLFDAGCDDPIHDRRDGPDAVTRKSVEEILNIQPCLARK